MSGTTRCRRARRWRFSSPACCLIVIPLLGAAHTESLRLEPPDGLEARDARELMSSCVCEGTAAHLSFVTPLVPITLAPLLGHPTEGFLRWPRSHREARGAPCDGITPSTDAEARPVAIIGRARPDEERSAISNRYVLCLLASGYRWKGVDTTPRSVTTPEGEAHDSRPDESGSFSPAVLEGIAACRAGDHERGLAVMLRAAEQGDAEAQYRVGIDYLNRGGIGKYELAVQWLERAIAQGHQPASGQLGTLYAFGRGVPRDGVRASSLIGVAAAAGYPGYQSDFGLMHRYGIGLPIDYSEMLRWLRLAAGQGSPRGRYNLAQAYKLGLGVRPDPEEAFRWFSLAARQGHQDSIERAMWGAREGVGTEKDLPLALAYVEILIADAPPGSPRGKGLAQLKSEFSQDLREEDLERARQLAAEIKKDIDAARAGVDLCQSPDLAP